MNRRKFLIGAGGLSLLPATSKLAVGQAAPALPPYYPSNYRDIVEGSRAEGKILVYTAAGANQSPGLLKRFGAMYPWIKIELLDLGTSEVVERYLAEAATGVATGDVIVTAGVDAVLRFVDKGELAAYESPELPHLPDWASPRPGICTYALSPMLMTWNKALLPAKLVPTGYADLVEKVKANPAVFDGKMGTYGAHFGSIGYCAFYGLVQLHGEKAWQWLEVLGPKSKLERSNGPLVEKATTGEYILGYNTAYSAAARAGRDPQRASIFGWKLVADAQILNNYAVVLTKSGRNKNAAKLWYDFMLSHEGALAAMEGESVPIHPGITPQERGDRTTYQSIVAEVGKENIYAVPFNRQIVEDYDKFIARWKKIYGV